MAAFICGPSLFIDRRCGSRCGGASGRITRQPTVSYQAVELDEAWLVFVSLPGVTREQLDLSLEGRSLALRVTQAEGASADDEPVLKSWELPEDIELDGISSKLSDNELVITLPKKKAQRFEIPIEHEAAPVTSQPEAPVPEEPAAAGPAEPGQAQRYDKATGEEDGSWVEVPDEGI